LGLAVVAIVFASSSIDYWTVMRFFRIARTGGARRCWKDQVFSRGLPSIFSICLSIRKCSDLHSCWRFFARWFFGRRQEAGNWLKSFGMAGSTTGRTGHLRLARVPCCCLRNAYRLCPHHHRHLLLGFAIWVYLGNYELLLNSHAFMTGADTWTKSYASVALAAHCGHTRRVAPRLDAEIQASSHSCEQLFCFATGSALIVHGVYVRPNEISIERPYTKGTSRRLRLPSV